MKILMIFVSTCNFRKQILVIATRIKDKDLSEIQ